MIKKLINPSIDKKPETKFLNEIHDGTFKTNKVNKEYLKSFRDERTGNDWFIMTLTLVFIAVIVILITSAIIQQNDQKRQTQISFTHY